MENTSKTISLLTILVAFFINVGYSFAQEIQRSTYRSRNKQTILTLHRMADGSNVYEFTERGKTTSGRFDVSADSVLTLTDWLKFKPMEVTHRIGSNPTISVITVDIQGTSPCGFGHVKAAKRRICNGILFDLVTFWQGDTVVYACNVDSATITKPFDGFQVRVKGWGTSPAQGARSFPIYHGTHLGQSYNVYLNAEKLYFYESKWNITAKEISPVDTNILPFDTLFLYKKKSFSEY